MLLLVRMKKFQSHRNFFFSRHLPRSFKHHRHFAKTFLLVICKKQNNLATHAPGKTCLRYKMITNNTVTWQLPFETNKLLTDSSLKMIILLPITLAVSVLGEMPPGNLTDLSQCKVSHFGLEYRGSVAKTESNVRCQSWSSDQPHKVHQDLTDDRFPLGSRTASKNFCRNPGETRRYFVCTVAII